MDTVTRMRAESLGFGEQRPNEELQLTRPVKHHCSRAPFVSSGATHVAQAEVGRAAELGR